MPNVSIIIPVYNAEKGIRRCIESVLNQEYSDYELILVDDGSKDSSPAILDEYAAHDARIKVIHKPNQGVSATRNRGLCEAAGTYVQFMDADDWLPPESTKILVRTAVEDECDLVVAGFYRVVNDRVARKSSLDDEDVLTLKEYSEYMKDNPADYYYGVLWNKLYRRDIIEKYNVRMEEGLSFCEDFVFNLEYLVHCQRIRALNVPVYYYVKTEGGLVSVNMNPARLVQMKLNIYTYYDQYFRDVLDEKQYNA
ncbi:MAG: glycosyltransferase [Solobacterium sp.]|nr:glycosyltransferase [Solobacterium sp.]